MKCATLSRWTALTLLLSACGEQAPETQQTTDAEPGVSATEAATAATEDASNVLAIFVGRHPSDEVDGRRFLDEPVVQQAVAQNVPDAEVRDFIFDYDGPDSPIVERDGRLVAWGCKRHECGYQNWSIVIAPDGSDAEICYYENPDDAEGTSTWYLPDGTTEERPGNCPAE